jgi:hypothetical protein
MTMKRKLRIGMLLAALLVMSVGTAMASGGSSYSTASTITVPEGEQDYYGLYTKYDTTHPDWWKFEAENGEDVYIDLDRAYCQNRNGDMKLYRTSSTYTAHVSSSSHDPWGTVSSSPWPRIAINGRLGTYCFVAGRYQ